MPLVVIILTQSLVIISKFICLEVTAILDNFGAINMLLCWYVIVLDKLVFIGSVTK